MRADINAYHAVWPDAAPEGREALAYWIDALRLPPVDLNACRYRFRDYQPNELLHLLTVQDKFVNKRVDHITDELPRMAGSYGIVVHHAGRSFVCDGRRRANQAVKKQSPMRMLEVTTPADVQPVVVSFYTPDWEYPRYAARLANLCDGHMIPYYIERLEGYNSYLKNTCMKPSFILDTLKRLKRPVLWLDADTAITEQPELTMPDCDIAAVPFTVPDTLGLKYHVSALYFNNTPESLKFLAEWSDNAGPFEDHHAFAETLENTTATIAPLDRSFFNGTFRQTRSRWDVKRYETRKHKGPKWKNKFQL